MWILRSSHKHISQETLSEYLDGRLQGRPLERVERQLGECDACRQELDELQATVSLMRQLPMETPHRSFVMSAPPPGLARARRAFVLRAPDWVYAGAASVAALALAITVSVDATGGLSPDSFRDDAPVANVAAARTWDQSRASGAAAGPVEESAVPPTPGAGAAAENGSDGAAPQSLTASVPSTAPVDQPAPLESAVVTPTAADAAPPSVVESTPPPASALPDVGDPAATVDGPAGESRTAKTLATQPPTAAPEPAGLESFNYADDGGTSVWWRLLEVMAGLSAVAFVAGLFLRRRSNRLD
ncbi:MAG: zf-HC2 domain-containing protein [Chloroflexi bacterium]|nr:zf-HC2 domain-containing protein [Chloroflexota bacterium]MDA1270888.1 zf-HC2 domain-containing protein [Chloroflexota bacterium]